MKTAEAKAVATPAKSSTPFFNKGADTALLKDSPGTTPFFNKNNEQSFFVQTKLNIGSPNDRYEQEADHMADRLLSGRQKTDIHTIAPVLQRKCSSCEDEEKKIHRKIAFPGATTRINSIESRLMQTKGRGNALPLSTQREMGRSFGADFSAVRVHDNSDAAQMNSALNAQAFTHRNDIYFNQGKYDPESNTGKHLLAHELTHTIQQGGISQQGAPQPASTTPAVAPSGRDGAAGEGNAAQPQGTQSPSVVSPGNAPPEKTDVSPGHAAPEVDPAIENTAAGSEQRGQAQPMAAGPNGQGAPGTQRPGEEIRAGADDKGQAQDSENTLGMEEASAETGRQTTGTVGAAQRLTDSPEALTRRIHQSREGELKRTALLQTAHFNLDALKSQLRVEQIAALRIAGIHRYVNNIRNSVRNFFVLRVSSIMARILEKQARLMLIITQFIGRLTTTANMITQQGMAMAAGIQARISLAILAASNFISNLLLGIRNEILNLVNSIPLPDLPGVDFLRTGLLAVVNLASNAIMGAISRVTGLLQNALSGALSAVGLILTTVNNYVSRILNLVLSAIMRIQQSFIAIVNRLGNRVINMINGLLNTYIFPTLLRGENFLIRQVNLIKRSAQQKIQANQRQHLSIIAHALAPGKAQRSNRKTPPVSPLQKALYLKEVTDILINRNHEIVNTFEENTSSIVAILLSRVQLIIQRIQAALQRAIDEFITSITNLVNSIIDAIVSFVQSAIAAFTGLLASIAAHFMHLMESVMTLLSNTRTRISGLFADLTENIGRALHNSVSSFVGSGSPGPVVGFAGPALAPQLAELLLEVAPIVEEVIIIEVEIIEITIIVEETALVAEEAAAVTVAAWEIVLIVVIVIIILIIIALLVYLLYLIIEELLKPEPAPQPEPIPIPDPDPEPDPEPEEPECSDDLEFFPAAPTGLSLADPIPITWYKPIVSYPDPIDVGGFDYFMAEQTTLPFGEPIGVNSTFFPYIGKIMQLRFEEDRGNEGIFRDVLTRHGFDWDDFEGEAYSPDHVQDVMWSGIDDFSNLWPLERVFNREAGRVQNQHQRITFRPDPQSPCAAILITIQRARLLYHADDRFYIIRAIEPVF